MTSQPVHTIEFHHSNLYSKCYTFQCFCNVIFRCHVKIKANKKNFYTLNNFRSKAVGQSHELAGGASIVSYCLE